MAIWIKAEQVERVHGELLAMASEGANLWFLNPDSSSTVRWILCRRKMKMS